jgi:flagellar biosynthesis GTPase FlhF
LEEVKAALGGRTNKSITVNATLTFRKTERQDSPKLINPKTTLMKPIKSQYLIALIVFTIFAQAGAAPGGRKNRDGGGGSSPQQPGNNGDSGNSRRGGPAQQPPPDASRTGRPDRPRDPNVDGPTGKRKGGGEPDTTVNRPGDSKPETHREGPTVSKRRDTGGPTGKGPQPGRIDHPDGSHEINNHQYGRDGHERAQESVKYDSHSKIVSKTVIKTVNKTTIENNYRWGRYGYVYEPSVVVLDPVWSDPYWYTPAGVVVAHPFAYSWGWNGGWYNYYGSAWTAYPVYPTPSYWVTDWMVAGYLQDHYDASISAQQAHAEAIAAHEEADKARRVAEAAEDAAEKAEAQLALERAQKRAADAAARAAKAEKLEESAKSANPQMTPPDKDTKEALRNQIEQTIAEKKAFAAKSKNGEAPVPRDVSSALADPKHIYPVSKTISVTSGDEMNPAGSLSEGDLLKLAPGQEEALKSAGENTIVKMKVITSKGEDGEATAGTTVNVAVKDLQEFDSEFRAMLDAGLAEAEKNKDLFKNGAVAN